MNTKSLPFIFAGLGITIASHATVWTVSNSGNTYTPASITIAVGDTVQFNISNDHDAVEVSEATYNANAATPLSGGFALGFGGGSTVPTLGTHWYVCSPHASMGMKGIIKVEQSSTIKDVFNTATFEMFPNPAQEKLTIRSSTNFKDLGFKVIDVTGKTIYSGKLNGNKAEVNTAALNAGTYYVTFGDGALVRLQSFVKK